MAPDLMFGILYASAWVDNGLHLIQGLLPWSTHRNRSVFPTPVFAWKTFHALMFFSSRQDFNDL